MDSEVVRWVIGLRAYSEIEWKRGFRMREVRILGSGSSRLAPINN